MISNLDIINNGDYLFIKVTGTIESESEHIKHAENLFRIVKENNAIKVLLDETEVEYFVSLINIYELVNIMSEKFPADIKNLRVAGISKPKYYKEFFTFYESVSNNRGFQFKNFYDIESAKKWLLNQ